MNPTPRLCGIDGCGRIHCARGFCYMHWERWRKGVEDMSPDPIRTKRNVEQIRARDEHGRKECATCGAWYPESDYYAMPGRADGLVCQCKKCRSVVNRNAKVKRYGITHSDVDRMMRAQNHCCAICLAPLTQGKFHIDHDHRCCSQRKQSCGACVRGLLCSACNTGIGHFEEDLERLKRAALYIVRNSSPIGTTIPLIA